MDKLEVDKLEVDKLQVDKLEVDKFEVDKLAVDKKHDRKNKNLMNHFRPPPASDEPLPVPGGPD